METSYPVILNLKVPWLSKTFFLFMACLVVLILFGVHMMPSRHSSGEMKTAYFILTTSEFEKKVIVFAFLGAPLFFILFRFCRLKRQGLLSLLPDKIEVDNFKTVTSYSINEITHIACNDAMDSSGFPKGKLTIDFKDKTQKVTSMLLIDYGQSDEIMNKILAYENIKFIITDFSMSMEELES
jgi:hypothetical protein